MFAYRSIQLLDCGCGEVDLPAGIPELLSSVDVEPPPSIDLETWMFQELVNECWAAMNNEDDRDYAFEIGGEG